ncbi:hypothetical protein IPM09_00325 [Candidatus Saccharibacteria bacterium]|nr:MAG: hypothetical protein IPM09_00325 [Candidatus Saccharibacteria bacterium]
MTFLIMLGIYLAILFVVGFFSRKSMGVPALALAAGAVLAKLWTDSLTPLIAGTGVIIVRPPLSSIVAIALTLIPALILMIRAPKATHHHHSWYSSLLFAVLAAMLTYGAFANAVVLDEASKQYVVQLLAYDKYIITAGIVLALFDIMFYKKPLPRDHHKK